MSGTATNQGRQRLPHDARRRLIIETTLASLARRGADGTSLRLVCRDMGVAPSLVTHFFSGWHDVLVAAYDLLTEGFMARLTPILAQEYPTARARMVAVIGCYLALDGDGGGDASNNVGANIAFWQLSRTVIELQAAFARFLQDRQRVLRGALAEVAAESGRHIDLDDMTACFILMMDGIWLEMSLNPDSISAPRAHKMCWAWIDAVVGRGHASAGQYQPA